ncbi:DUF3775 domain-containing protein [Maritimibacter dapengensis]|uniref:DUF3775 domain-containing protein n=1 Tax=Maritimibacter dapengensis TaxID=2836868 RepID=A0ABS6SWK0_9RHOB|nr:DUF3775 domain-containing protein [Maritimibacter dapengensis]MBV7377329.1 DUF3775 domain-containing protein [Maritimibacter dapengensis]
MLEISPSRIARIAIQARELPATEAVIRSYIADLNTDEQASLVAVMWIGRETFDAEDLSEAIETAKAEATAPTEDYLMGETMLADYLEAGLEALGYDVEDLEDEHLK